MAYFNAGSDEVWYVKLSLLAHLQWKIWLDLPSAKSSLFRLDREKVVISVY